ncbi:MAG: hypothetical protein FWC79_05835 [Oscillospiraceae bacterium]|nr:hypothetical protein [Oscillospiraceae bacterium]
MAKNPMQRKITNAFLLGLVLMLLIAVAIGGVFFVLVLLPQQQERDADRAVSTMAYVAIREIEAGEPLLSGVNVELREVRTDAAAIGSLDSVTEEDMEVMLDMIEFFSNRTQQQREAALADARSVDRADLEIQFDRREQIISAVMMEAEFRLSMNTLVAVSPIEGNTIITNAMVRRGALPNDLRYVEYNMLTLPIDVNVGDYIDVRLTLPSGQDFVVISRKQIVDKHANTITLHLTEDEIMMMSSAIVESYVIRASNLYVVKYVDPVIQGAITPTYQVSDYIVALMSQNPNISAQAENAFWDRHHGVLRTHIEYYLHRYENDRIRNIETRMAEQIQRSRDARQQFLGHQ